MGQLSFVTLDVFTQTRYAGNPLAVVRVHDGVHMPTTEQMLAIAKEFNLSETIFLHDAKNGVDGVIEWRVRIFFTNGELPFAGHPTIGAAVYALGTLSPTSHQGRLMANAGPIQLTYDPASGIAKASIPHNFHLHTQYPCSLEELYDLQPALRGVVTSSDAVQVTSPVKGLNFVQAELPDLHALSKISTGKKPQPRLDDEWNEGFSASHFYVITSATPARDQNDTAKYQLRTRMIQGSSEDPATGSAACALTSYLALKNASSRISRFELTQGVEMGRESHIEVTITLNADLGSIERVELGGTAVKVMEGIVEY
ncbi:hypothetical protein AC578_4958 [Pseudocercospora eumusae]|uniref:Phenazine biosynthesis protein n=1 Tax=Pseudocercospora eumusae TaxID=321146 RepID=A0A139HNT4_9PEZI|nr:hypothetical protein AC578_4958 [Pseudocercospora eumusae]